MNCPSLTTYRHGCRCPECVAVAARYAKGLEFDWHRGIKRLVDAKPAHDHINMLLAAGMRPAEIARAIGYTKQLTVATLLKQGRIRRSTMQRVLAVAPPTTPDDLALVSPIGATRRLRALTVMGWSQVGISVESGLNECTISELINGHSQQIRYGTHRAVAAVYERLCMSHGGSNRAWLRGLRNKWAPPLAWDDIDDPNEIPQGMKRRKVA